MRKSNDEKMRTPREGDIYRHFKGSLYEVVTIAVHTETSEKLVVYRSVDNNDRVFARPLEMFLSKVDHIKYPFIRAKYRFTLVEDGDKSEAESADVAAEDEAAEVDVAEPTEETVSENLAPEDIVDINESDDAAATSKASVDENSITEHDVLNDTSDINMSDTLDTADINLEDDIKDESDVYTLDPIVEKLLDAKDYTDKIQCFDLLRGKCDNHILNIIAVSHDIELADGTVEDKYAQILKHLKMHEKYETTRLR